MGDIRGYGRICGGYTGIGEKRGDNGGQGRIGGGYTGIWENRWRIYEDKRG